MRTGVRHYSPRAAEQGGSVLLLVIVLLVWLGVIVVSNGTALQHLKRELKLLEERQIKTAANDWRIHWDATAVPSERELSDSRKPEN